MQVLRGTVAVVLLLCGATDLLAEGAGAQGLEYEVKAAYLFNLVNFDPARLISQIAQAAL